MRRAFLLGLAGWVAGCAAAQGRLGDLSPDGLKGLWKVDLRPVPEAAAYFQAFDVTDIMGLTFTGTFYGAPISEARLNVAWGAIRFAFVTADLAGPYHHSGVLKDGRIEGLTNSLGRSRLSFWSAVKEA